MNVTSHLTSSVGSKERSVMLTIKCGLGPQIKKLGQRILFKSLITHHTSVIHWEFPPLYIFCDSAVRQPYFCLWSFQLVPSPPAALLSLKRTFRPVRCCSPGSQGVMDCLQCVTTPSSRRSYL